MGLWESADKSAPGYRTLSIGGGRGDASRAEMWDTGANAFSTDKKAARRHGAIGAGEVHEQPDGLVVRMTMYCAGLDPQPISMTLRHHRYQNVLVDSDTGARWNRVDPAADPLTIYTGGDVVTMDEDLPRAEAVAIRRGRIVAVGDADQIGVLTEPTARIVHLRGKTMVPGFIDSHAHRICDRDVGGLGPVELSVALAVRNGWTSVGEMFVHEHDVVELIDFDTSGRLTLRVDAYLPVNYHDDHFGVWFSDYQPRQILGDRLRIGGAKIFVDQADPARMYLTEPTVGENPDHGHASWTPEGLTTMVNQLHADGWQIAVHTIGDAAHDMVLDAFEDALAGQSNDGYRHRIEHVAMVRNDQISRMKTLGVIASVQLTWFVSDWLGSEFWSDYEVELDQQRHRWLGRWRDLLDEGVRVVGGTDTPWTPASSSMKVLHEAATRIGDAGRAPRSWMLDQRITVEEALRSITIDAAYGTFDEHLKGSISPGKYADLVVLSANPLEVDVEQLLDIEVLCTIIDGEVVYCSPANAPMCLPPSPDG